MKYVFIINNMFFRPTFCVEINFVGPISIKCTQSTFPGVLTHLCAFSKHSCMCISQFLEIDSSMTNFSIMHPCNHFDLWTVNKKSEKCVTLHRHYVQMSLWITYQNEDSGWFTSRWFQELFDTPSYVTRSRGMSRMSEMLFLRYWQKQCSNSFVLYCF